MAGSGRFAALRDKVSTSSAAAGAVSGRPRPAVCHSRSRKSRRESGGVGGARPLITTACGPITGEKFPLLSCCFESSRLAGNGSTGRTPPTPPDSRRELHGFVDFAATMASSKRLGRAPLTSTILGACDDGDGRDIRRNRPTGLGGEVPRDSAERTEARLGHEGSAP